MSLNEDSVISAQVILRPSGGRVIDGTVVITAINLAEFAPSPSDVSLATTRFRSMGFDVGPIVGVSFSITGTVRTFERALGTRIRRRKDDDHEFVVKNKPIGRELSGDRLPERIRTFVQAIVFPPPPDFGPPEFNT